MKEDATMETNGKNNKDNAKDGKMSEPENEEKIHKNSKKEKTKKMKKETEKDDKKMDLINYKGMYFNDDKEKQFDTDTNAHFMFPDMCTRLQLALKQRTAIEIKLGIHYDEDSSSGCSGNISSKDLDETDKDKMDNQNLLTGESKA